MSIKKNTLFYYLQFIASSVSVFLVSPILASNLGGDGFGLWKICQRVIDFAAIFDGKSGQTLKSMIAIEIGGGNSNKKKSELIGAAFFIWLKSIPHLIISCAILIYLLPVMSSGVDNNTIYIVAILLSIGVLIGPFFSIPEAVLMATENSYRSSFVQVFGYIISGILCIFASRFVDGILFIATSVVAVILFNAVVLNIMARKLFSWYRFIKPNKIDIENFGTFSRPIVIWTAVEKIFLMIDVIMIGYFCGSDYVAKFTFSSYAFQLAIVVCLIGTSAIVPVLSRNYGAGDLNLINKNINSIRVKVFYSAVIFSCGIIGFNDIFVSTWAGEVNYIDKFFDEILAFILVQTAFIRAEGQMLDAGQKVKEKTILMAFSVIFAVGMCFVAKMIYGSVSVNFVIASIFFGRLPAMFILPILVNKYFCVRVVHYKIITIAVLILILFVLQKNFIGNLFLEKILFLLNFLGILFYVKYKYYKA